MKPPEYKDTPVVLNPFFSLWLAYILLITQGEEQVEFESTWKVISDSLLILPALILAPQKLLIAASVKITFPSNMKTYQVSKLKPSEVCIWKNKKLILEVPVHGDAF